MTAPTKSSLRSGERLSHQLTETGSGGFEVRGADFPFAAGVLLFPGEEVSVLPLGFPLDLEAGAGVLRGIRQKYSTNGLFFFCRSSHKLQFKYLISGFVAQVIYACGTL
jgi:hypothetical protein